MLIVTATVAVVFGLLMTAGKAPLMGLWFAGFVPVVWGIVQLIRRDPRRGGAGIAAGLLMGGIGLTGLPETTTAAPAPQVVPPEATNSPSPTPAIAPLAEPTPTPLTPDPPPASLAPAPAPPTTAPQPPRSTVELPPTTIPPAAPPPERTTTRPSTTRSSPATSPTVRQTDSSDATGGGVYYRNCDEVRKAGKDPIYRGQPGYRPGLDGDNDGIACDITG